ncbi:MAG: phosphate signaling complex protein PhoU, partial [Alphaproteobacteria bacterium]
SDDSGHIVQSFDDDLEGLQDAVRRMGAMVAEQIARCGDLISNGAADAAGGGNLVIEVDRAVDALELEINDRAVVVITKRQPMADDLRVVLTAMKMAGALERAGDYAKNIAKRLSALQDQGAVEGISGALVAMSRLAEAQIRSAMQAYNANDAELALAVWADDVELDRLHNEAHGQILSAMRRSQAHDLSHVMFIAKNLERIGDYATNLAEMVHFLASGHYPEDERPKADKTAQS